MEGHPCPYRCDIRREGGVDPRAGRGAVVLNRHLRLGFLLKRKLGQQRFYVILIACGNLIETAWLLVALEYERLSMMPMLPAHLRVTVEGHRPGSASKGVSQSLGDTPCQALHSCWLLACNGEGS